MRTLWCHACSATAAAGAGSATQGSQRAPSGGGDSFSAETCRATLSCSAGDSEKSARKRPTNASSDARVASRSGVNGAVPSASALCVARSHSAPRNAQSARVNARSCARSSVVPRFALSMADSAASVAACACDGSFSQPSTLARHAASLRP